MDVLLRERPHVPREDVDHSGAALVTHQREGHRRAEAFARRRLVDDPRVGADVLDDLELLRLERQTHDSASWVARAHLADEGLTGAAIVDGGVALAGRV